jgi:hypothetical protein
VIWENPHHAGYRGTLPGSDAGSVTAAETVTEGAA